MISLSMNKYPLPTQLHDNVFYTKTKKFFSDLIQDLCSRIEKSLVFARHGKVKHFQNLADTFQSPRLGRRNEIRHRYSTHGLGFLQDFSEWFAVHALATKKAANR